MCNNAQMPQAPCHCPEWWGWWDFLQGCVQLAPGQTRRALRWFLPTSHQQMCTQGRWACSKLRCSPWMRQPGGKNLVCLCPQEGSRPFLELWVVVGVASTPFCHHHLGPLLLTFQRAPRRKWRRRRATSANSLWTTSCPL